jgi:cytochrome o ubiquinol oxidase operon protein cyoD
MLDKHHSWNTSLKPLIAGFALSIVLTLVALFLAVQRIFSGWALLTAVVGLGAVQACVQLVAFLHVGLESKPRWNLIHLLFLFVVMVAVVGGSLWIMYNLNDNVMPMAP